MMMMMRVKYTGGLYAVLDSSAAADPQAIRCFVWRACGPHLDQLATQLATHVVCCARRGCGSLACCSMLQLS